MRILTVVVATLALTAALIAGQTPAAKKTYAPPHTAWGEPDLQGKWSYATITPLERPTEKGGTELLSAAEVEALNEDALTSADRRDGTPEADLARAYNAYWYDRGKSIGRTSLIIDPPDGRLPPLTEEGDRKSTRLN